MASAAAGAAGAAAPAATAAKAPADAKVARMREAMAAADGGRGVQAFIVPSEDPHMVSKEGGMHFHQARNVLCVW